MNQLLEQEKTFFDSVMNKETDKDTISAFYDYATFLSDKGVSLVAHLHTQLKEYQNEIAEYEKLYADIFEKITADTNKLEKLVEKLKLKNDHILIDRFQTLNNFFNGNYITFGSKKFDGPQSEFMDILRRLDDLGYRKEIEPYTIVYSPHDPTPKDAYAFEDRKKYYSLLKAFDKKHSQSVIGALTRIMGTLADLNNPESESSYTRSSLVAHIDKVHNSIVFNNPKADEKSSETKDKIFWLEGDDIYHYELGPLIYSKRHGQDPKYITMFKSIIRYMPKGREEIRVTEFENLLQTNERFREKGKEVYKSNLGSAGRSFSKFLKKNKFHNTHPKSKKPIIEVSEYNIDFRNNL